MLLDRIACTTYVDAVCCCRLSSVVCRCVCHTSEPGKNGWTDWDAVWLEDSGGSREPCIRWGPDPPMERGNFKGGKGCPIVKYRTLCGHMCKNGWTDRDAIWILGSDWSKESWIRWGSRSPHERGSILGKGMPVLQYGDFLPWAVQKQLNRLVCHLGCGLAWAEWSTQVQSYLPSGASVHNFNLIREVAPMYQMTLCRELCKNSWTGRFAIWVVESCGPKEAEVQSHSPGGANVPTWEGTLVPPGEYYWTISLRQRCGLTSDYFDYFFCCNALIYCYKSWLERRWRFSSFLDVVEIWHF